MDTTTTSTLDTVTNTGSLLRLLQLASPALPIGAYAYSQGLEQAVENGWINDEESTQNWLCGILSYAHAYLDIPVLIRLYNAWQNNDENSLAYWNAYLYAAREAKELQQEDDHLGKALARLLVDLDIANTDTFNQQQICFATSFSFAAQCWGIPLQATLNAYLWAWSENQVAAATKLIPLGQTAGQRILSQCMSVIEGTVATGLTVNEDNIGCSLPALAIASALHETQYSRLFRS